MTPSPSRHRMPLIEIPKGILPTATTKAETYRLLIGIAFKHGLTPQMVDLGQAEETAPIFIQVVQLAKLQAVADEYKISLQAAFAGLCAAAIEMLSAQMKKQIKTEKTYVKESGLAAMFPEARPDQKNFFEGIMRGLNLNKVVLAEASTGVGKGRAMMVAAVKMVKQGKKPVIVAAPTIQVMGQLYLEYEALAQEDTAKIILSILPGRSEFVDSQKLRHLLNYMAKDSSDLNISPEDLEKVREWVDTGGPSTKTALAATMKRIGIEPSWLADQLREITDNFPVEDFLLSSDCASDCDAEVLLKEYKKRVSFDADIILCTHAMLAIGQKNQWSPAILPQPSVLFVDEAHQLEQTVAQFNAEQLSLFSLRWRISSLIRQAGLSSGTVASKAVKTVNTIIGHCRDSADDMAHDIRLDMPQTDKETVEYGHILHKLNTLRNLIKSKTLDEVDDIKSDRKALAALALAIEKGGKHKRVHCMFSPTRSYPSIQAGTADIGQQLGHIWKSAEGGVVLASATLFIPDADGSLRSDYIRNVLALPVSRLYEPDPIEAEYIYTLPTLHYPAKDKCERLSPPRVTRQSFSARPKKDDKAETAEEAWLGAVAAELVNGPLQNAVGGTLVLCTAYSQLETLTRKLPELGIDTSRLIAQVPNKKFELTKTEFINAYRAGLRPVLLALGLAWTGLDLLDKTVEDPAEAHKDNLLTDLVIVRCPLGLNRSTTMLVRIEGRGVDPIIKEALLMLKQGLGRLIRRDKAQNRHLWIMDGRLWRPWDGMERFTGAARSILGKYKKNERF